MERTDDSARTVECAQARALIERFAESTLAAEDSQAMRAHLVGCEVCAARYRETIESVGRSAAAAREVRERKQAEAERAQRVHDTVAGQVREPRKHRNWRLRTILLPAFFASLMIMVFRSQAPKPAFRVDSAIGEIEVTGRPLASYGEHEVVLRRGARCITGANSSVRLDTEDCTLALGELSEVMIVRLRTASRAVVRRLAQPRRCVHHRDGRRNTPRRRRGRTRSRRAGSGRLPRGTDAGRLDLPGRGRRSDHRER